MQTVTQLLKIYKPQIDTFLHDYLEQKTAELAKHPWSTDALERLSKTVTQGKSVRGSLVLFMNELLGTTQHPDAVRVAAALELTHAALLIHDDIMDRDTIRRGHTTFHHQYAEQAVRYNISEAEHFGYSMGIAAGIMTQHLAFDIITHISVGRQTMQRLLSAFSHDISRTTFAQMQDVYSGLTNNHLSIDEIIHIHTYKTAVYTFSLPFTIGGILHNANQATISQLRKLGEYFGVAFQLKDDELGLFGDEQTTGKPRGSDIREGKQTLYFYYAFKYAKPSEQQRLRNIFGNQSATNVDLEYIIMIVDKYNIQEKITTLTTSLTNKAHALIPHIPVVKQHHTTLTDMMSYILKRTK